MATLILIVLAFAVGVLLVLKVLLWFLDRGGPGRVVRTPGSPQFWLGTDDRERGENILEASGVAWQRASGRQLGPDIYVLTTDLVESDFNTHLHADYIREKGGEYGVYTVTSQELRSLLGEASNDYADSN